MSGTRTRVFVFLICSAVLSAVTWAQVTTATFSGIVSDPSGGMIPGAEARLINEGTGAVLSKVTNDLGEFVFNFVPAGTYTLKIEMPGFKVFESTGIELLTAQNVRQQFELQVGEVTETVTVAGESPLVNTVSPEQRQSFSNLQLRELPIFRRNLTYLLRVGTGMSVNVGSGLIRMNGLGLAGTKFTVDGTDAGANPEAPGISMYQGVNQIHGLSLEAVREVQTIKGVIPAEYGQALAGNVNLISQSGTNEWHGSLFYNYEGAGLNARHQFARTKPNVIWNQFGGSLGGPVIRDRAFFFFTYEGYRNHNFSISSGQVPTQKFRDQIAKALTVPETKVLLDAYPLPNEPAPPDALIGRWRGPRSRVLEDDHFVFRGDVQVGDSGNVAVSYTRARPFRLNPSWSPVNERTWASRQERVTASYVIGAAAWTLESRFGFNFNDFHRTDGFWNFTDPVNKEDVLGRRRMPFISMPGLSGLGSELNDLGKAPTYTAEEKFAYVKGRHSLKFGGIWARRGGGRLNIENVNVRFPNPTELLANRPTQVTATLGMNDNRSRSWDLGFFVHDDWRVNSRLVFNLGLRWDGFSRFVAEPTDPSAPAFLWNLDGLRDFKTWTFGPLRDPLKPIEGDWVNFGPRLGLAYNPDGKGKNVIRAGFSMMFTPIPWGSFNNAVGTSPTIPFRIVFSKKEAQQLGLKWPLYNGDVIKLLEGSKAVNLNDFFDPELDAPYAYNMYFGVQRSITKDLMFETAYVGTRGVKFIMEREVNLPDRLTGIRANPNLKQGTYFDNSEQTYYHSWQTSVRQRFARGLLFGVHYTWGKAIGIDGGDNAASFSGDSTGSIQDSLCVPCDRGRSTGDVDHTLSAEFLYELPFLANASSAVKNAFGGWQISGIVRAATGGYFNVEQSNIYPNQRVDLLDFKNAIRNECCGFGNLQYLNTAAFKKVPVIKASDATARPGTMGNQALHAPGWWLIDASLGKNLYMPWFAGERARLLVRVDMLNVLNHTNYQSPETNPDQRNFGEIEGTTGARTIQLQARISF